jgi:peroxiredoxin family protein
MSKKILKNRVFTNGAARFHDLVYIISQDKSMIEDGISHSSVIGVDMGKWADCINTNWTSTAIAVAKKPVEKMVVVGEDGEICTYVGGISNEEKKLLNVSMIRNANSINGYVYACGMQRQVYKRDSENLWTDISATFPSKSEKAGFESIDGFS